MKLLEIISSADPAHGGPIEGIVRLDAASHAAGLGVTRELVTLDPPDAPFLADVPMRAHALGRARSGSRLPWRRALEHWGHSPDFEPWLRAHLADYDAAIVNGLWNYASFGAGQVLPGSARPYFVFTHGMMDPWFRRRYPLKHLAKQAFWMAGEGRLLAGAASVFFTCEEERLKARNQFWGHAAHVETVVGYGAAAPPPKSPTVDAAFRAAAPTLGARDYLLFLSRIHPKKGCDLLIQGFAAAAGQQPEIDLVIVGPDPTGWRPELEALASRLGVSDRIHWTGPLYGDAKWGALHGADAFVLPSHQENFGIAVAEALGCGTPVLISDKIDIWREIDAAGAGVVRPDTVEGATAMIRDWMRMDDTSRAAMRRAGRSLFEERFNVAGTAMTLARTIESLR